MSSFGLTAGAQTQPVAAPQNYPRPLDIQVNGVSLGPGITTLNFVGAEWDISVGTGDNADTVTIALA